jgi:hypothetical protein
MGMYRPGRAGGGMGVEAGQVQHSTGGWPGWQAGCGGGGKELQQVRKHTHMHVC